MTPQTNINEFDDASKIGIKKANTETVIDYESHHSVGFPKSNRTISNIYQDELCNIASIPVSLFSRGSSANEKSLNPYYYISTDYPKAANQIQIHSQYSTTINHEQFPCRQNSPLALEIHNVALQSSSPMTNNMPMVEYHMQMPKATTASRESKIMHPMNASLDFSEGEDVAMTPLSSTRADFNLGDKLRQVQREESSLFQLHENIQATESPSRQHLTAAISQQYPFANTEEHWEQTQHSSQQHLNSLLQSTSEFPALWPSSDMTSNDWAANAEMSHPQAPPKMKDSILRPVSGSPDCGFYICVYNNCTLRFRTLAKLHQHKREAHRQNTPSGYLLRNASACNSQAGPYRCELINPSTDKPCNSTFSRPYDLTRHKNTVHNSHKVKVKCRFCTEKSFSRHDALARHMRAIPPSGINYQRAQREFRNEWQRQCNRLVRENLERYKDEQPVIDSERQLAGKLMDEEVMGALERTGYMTPQHMILIDIVLTMPGSTVEKEYQRRIAAINAVIALCDVEEGSPTRRPIGTQKQKRCATDALQSTFPAKKRACLSPGERETPICQAIASVCIKNPKDRPTICFLCLGTSLLPKHERLKTYKTPGSLSALGNAQWGRADVAWDS